MKAVTKNCIYYLGTSPIAAKNFPLTMYLLEHKCFSSLTKVYQQGNILTHAARFADLDEFIQIEKKFEEKGGSLEEAFNPASHDHHTNPLMRAIEAKNDAVAKYLLLHEKVPIFDGKNIKYAKLYASLSVAEFQKLGDKFEKETDERVTVERLINFSFPHDDALQNSCVHVEMTEFDRPNQIAQLNFFDDDDKADRTLHSQSLVMATIAAKNFPLTMHLLQHECFSSLMKGYRQGNILTHALKFADEETFEQVVQGLVKSGMYGGDLQKILRYRDASGVSLQSIVFGELNYRVDFFFCRVGLRKDFVSAKEKHHPDLEKYSRWKQNGLAAEWKGEQKGNLNDIAAICRGIDMEEICPNFQISESESDEGETGKNVASWRVAYFRKHYLPSPEYWNIWQKAFEANKRCVLARLSDGFHSGKVIDIDSNELKVRFERWPDDITTYSQQDVDGECCVIHPSSEIAHCYIQGIPPCCAGDHVNRRLHMGWAEE